MTNSFFIFDDIFGFSIVSELSMYHVRNKLHSLKMIVFICYIVVTLLHLRYGCLITGNTPTKWGPLTNAKFDLIDLITSFKFSLELYVVW